MEDVDKEPEERKTTMHYILFFVEKFEGNNTGVGHDINSRDQQEINTRTNQQEQQSQNHYEIGKTGTGIDAAATGMKCTSSFGELGYLNQKSLLKKGLKIREIIDNARQKIWLTMRGIKFG